MRRWILGIGLVLLLLAGTSVILYKTVRTSLADHLDQAEETVLAEEGVDAVNHVYYYYGNEAVYTVDAKLANGSREWFFLSGGSVVDHYPAEDVLTPSAAEELVQQRFDRNSIRSVKPGMENGEPLYEVTFESDGTLHYYYLSLKNGDYLKRYSLQKSS